MRPLNLSIQNLVSAMLASINLHADDRRRIDAQLQRGRATFLPALVALEDAGKSIDADNITPVRDTEGSRLF